MTRVQFYTLDSDDRNECLKQACRLTERAYAEGRKVQLIVDDLDTARQLDTLLWTFHDLAFVPHALEPQNAASSWPVVISRTQHPDDPRDYLVNLGARLPDSLDTVQEIAEIVIESGKQAARERYRSYQKQGAQLAHHHLGPGGAVP
jgi:DNA polymerase III subunit chi